MRFDTVRAKCAEAAHDAYHDHNETCRCRTVGHLTACISDRVLAAIELDGVSYLTGPDYSEAVKRAAVAIADTIGDPVNHPFYAECFIRGLSAFLATEGPQDD